MASFCCPITVAGTRVWCVDASAAPPRELLACLTNKGLVLKLTKTQKKNKNSQANSTAGARSPNLHELPRSGHPESLLLWNLHWECSGCGKNGKPAPFTVFYRARWQVTLTANKEFNLLCQLNILHKHTGSPLSTNQGKVYKQQIYPTLLRSINWHWKL